MSSPSLSTAEHCIKRSDKMQTTASNLRSDDDEWFAVCYFYAAYHVIRAALLEDPVFNSLKRLGQVSTKHRMNLTMADRDTQRHTGRKTPGAARSVGINDLVRILYPESNVAYHQLHGASVDVRYKSGLSRVDAGSAQENYLAVAEAYRAGRLVAAEIA